MDYNNFIGQVQHRAHLPDTEHAVKSTRAVLQTLGERLFDGESSDLAAQLPDEIGYYIKVAEGDAKYSLEQFYQKVANRENVEMQDAIHHTKAVMSVLCEAVSGGELQDVGCQLPSEYSEIFEKQWS